jgi:hypothetical protein
MVGRLDSTVATLAGDEIQRKDRPKSAAFFGRSASMFVGQEVFHRPEQKRSEPSSLRIGDRQKVFGQQADEELLR